MATTTNYGWDTPDDTDLVKDGAAAIRTLGSSVDTTTKALNPSTTLGDIEYRSATANTNTRLAIGSTGNVLTVSGGVPAWAAPAPAVSGLTLIKSQTIGSGVSTVTVTDAFSSTYDNYKIIISGGAGSATSEQLRLQLGSTTTGYYRFAIFGNYTGSTVNGENVSNGSYWQGVGTITTANVTGNIDLLSPNLAKNTSVLSNYSQSKTDGNAFWFSGFLNDTTQYTAFTITPSGGTLTGGTIRVYGYQNS
jgi:hypothetical protein